MTGPMLQQLNLSIYKNFAVTEKLRFQIRAEATNALNHVNYPNPTTAVDVSTFMNVTTGEAGVNTTAPPRIIRLGAKIIF